MTQKCSNCDSPLEENAEFCENCNTPVDCANEKQDSPFYNKLTIVLAVLVVLAIVGDYGSARFFKRQAIAREEQAQAKIEQLTAEAHAAQVEKANKNKMPKDQKTENLVPGESVTLEDGIVLTLDSVKKDIEMEDNYKQMKKYVCVTFTFKNTGETLFPISEFENITGKNNNNSPMYYTLKEDGAFMTNKKNYLTPGSSITGEIYFPEDCVRVYYMSTPLSLDHIDVWWNI